MFSSICLDDDRGISLVVLQDGANGLGYGCLYLLDWCICFVTSVEYLLFLEQFFKGHLDLRQMWNVWLHEM